MLSPLRCCCCTSAGCSPTCRVGRETGRFLGGVVGAAAAGRLPGRRSAALVAALTIRRGLAVAAVIVVLLVSYTVVSTIQGISSDTGHETVGEVAGLFSPYTLVNGRAGRSSFDSPAGHRDAADRRRRWASLYLVAHRAHRRSAAVGAMLARYRKVGTR